MDVNISRPFNSCGFATLTWVLRRWGLRQVLGFKGAGFRLMGLSFLSWTNMLECWAAWPGFYTLSWIEKQPCRCHLLLGICLLLTPASSSKFMQLLVEVLSYRSFGRSLVLPSGMAINPRILLRSHMFTCTHLSRFSFPEPLTRSMSCSGMDRFACWTSSSKCVSSCQETEIKNSTSLKRIRGCLRKIARNKEVNVRFYWV